MCVAIAVVPVGMGNCFHISVTQANVSIRHNLVALEVPSQLLVDLTVGWGNDGVSSVTWVDSLEDVVLLLLVTDSSGSTVPEPPLLGVKRIVVLDVSSESVSTNS